MTYYVQGFGQNKMHYGVPKKSVVQVFFPSVKKSYAYYNDSFDLKVGDFVYVEGCFEGERGQVASVNYSFKIKLSDYKKVVSVIDTNVSGDFNIANSMLVSFDRSAIPFHKVSLWFNPPTNEDDFASGDDNSEKFPLDELGKMNISQKIAERGHEYYLEDRVAYLSLDGFHGYAIVRGSENYEVEFDFQNGEISNLKCSCFCTYHCKHEFAAMLQLKDTLKFITENLQWQYYSYFAAISKDTYGEIVLGKNSGKIHVEV